MEKGFLFALSLITMLLGTAQEDMGYKSLDLKQPIVFRGNYLVYKGDTIVLGPKHFFIDGQLTDQEVAKHPYVFNSVQKAAAHLTDGTEVAPIVLHIAPYVYWIDDPDDPAIRVPEEGATPYGMTIRCEWLKFSGLSDNPQNVVLASNRGQTIGAKGNFTMFRFIGQGTSSENLTFGNYCNIDLQFPLLPKLNRKKRATAIVQAQLIHCNGDKVVARNTWFVSRLNLCPFAGAKRALFDRCHFESTDDALCSTGLYLNSTFDFWASKPFYNTTGTGAVFLNCDIRSYTRGAQYLTKANGQVAILDSRFNTEAGTYLGWNEVIPFETRNYQYQVSQDGKPVFISKKDPEATVDLSGKRLLDAYRFVHNGKVVYNTYNLLSGDDDWDPMGIRDSVLAMEKETNRKYTKLPVQLLISPSRVAIETKKEDIVLTAKVNRFGNYRQNGETIKWSVPPNHRSFVQLQVSEDGMSCRVTPTNSHDTTQQVVVLASTPSGLQAASVLQVAPAMLEAPTFRSTPTLSVPSDGKLHASYKLNSAYKDQSAVTWYRCSDEEGRGAVEVAVSRFNKPMLQYTLSPGDVGYYLMIGVAPKHIRSKTGAEMEFVMKRPIAASDVKTAANLLVTDFSNLSVRNQPRVLPGFWTWEHFEPGGTEARFTIDKEKDAWFYGTGSDGAADMTGLLQGRSAAMRYTPVGKSFGDMNLSITVAPFKTAGQGFSVAHLYMDVLIKFDTKSMSGYALRFIRTTKYHDAVDCLFVKYENGKVTEISEPVSTTAFRSLCKISIAVNNNKMSAQVATSAKNATPGREHVPDSVNIATRITPNDFGGFGIQHNGGSPTLINNLKVQWKPKTNY